MKQIFFIVDATLFTAGPDSRMTQNRPHTLLASSLSKLSGESAVIILIYTIIYYYNIIHLHF